MPFGPIIPPKPGPTFDIDVAAPETAVTKSNPLIDNSVVIIKKIIIYRNTKDIIEEINFSLRTLSSGRATSTMEFSHYAATPSNVSEDVIKKANGTAEAN